MVSGGDYCMNYRHCTLLLLVIPAHFSTEYVYTYKPCITKKLLVKSPCIIKCENEKKPTSFALGMLCGECSSLLAFLLCSCTFCKAFLALAPLTCITIWLHSSLAPSILFLTWSLLATVVLDNCYLLSSDVDSDLGFPFSSMPFLFPALLFQSCHACLFRWFCRMNLLCFID